MRLGKVLKDYRHMNRMGVRVLAKELDMVIVTTSSSEPGDTRRAHTRALYNLLEDEIIAPALQLQLQPARAAD